MNGSTQVGTTQKVEGGKYATAPADPSKAADAQYTYTFAGWATSANSTSTVNVASTPINAATTFYAVYTPVVRKYKVTFNNADGSFKLQYTGVEYGKTIAQAGGLPVVADTDADGNPFVGWFDAKGNEVKADTVVKLLSGEITEDFPASILHKHPNTTVIIDQAAYSKVK